MGMDVILRCPTQQSCRVLRSLPVQLCNWYTQCEGASSYGSFGGRSYDAVFQAITKYSLNWNLSTYSLNKCFHSLAPFVEARRALKEDTMLDYRDALAEQRGWTREQYEKLPERVKGLYTGFYVEEGSEDCTLCELRSLHMLVTFSVIHGVNWEVSM